MTLPQLSTPTSTAVTIICTATMPVIQDGLFAIRFIKHAPLADRGLRGHVPTRPERTTPLIRFLLSRIESGTGSAPRFWIVADPELAAGVFLQTPPHDDAPGSGPGQALALFLTFGSVLRLHSG